MKIGLDGKPIEERRGVTPIGDTGSVPEGTMVTVPSAPPRGGVGTAPVVAVNTRSKWSDPIFLLTAVTSLGSTVTAIVDVLPSSGPIDWRATAPKIAFAVINGLAAFLRTQINSVTK